MIDGIRFISENYERVNNLNDREIYKELYHPDILWCPPGLPDKAGVDLVAFSFALKNFDNIGPFLSYYTAKWLKSGTLIILSSFRKVDGSESVAFFKAGLWNYTHFISTLLF